MKIAFVSQVFDRVVPPLQSSIGIWTYQIARRLADSNEVIVYLFSKKLPQNGEGKELFEYRYSKILSNRYFRRLNRELSRITRGKNPAVSLDLESLAYILEIALDLRKQGCDIVHIHNFSQFIPVIHILNPGVRIVLHMHCEWLSQLEQNVIERRLRHVDLILGVSQHITEKIQHRFPQYAEICHTVFNGVDVGQFASRDPRDGLGPPHTHILFAGRISPEKGVHDLIEAFKIVAAQVPNAQLHLVGNYGPLKREFLVGLSDESEITNLASFYQQDYQDYLRKQIPPELKENVIFHGFLPYTQMPSHYLNADILVNPSYSESFGMSLVEAMASEVPVVATRVGGMPEVVEQGKTGLLVQPGDIQALAQAILFLLENKQVRRCMGEAGRKRVLERFSWERIAGNLLNCYQEIA